MNRKFLYILLLPGTLFLIVFMIIPLLITILSTFVPAGQFSLEGYILFLTDAFYLQILWTTLKVSLITTLVCIVLGFPTAYYISTLNIRKKGIFIALAVFPLLTSSVVRSFSWMVILGRNGIINDILLRLHIINEPLMILYTPNATIIGLIHLFLPLMIISLVGVMENIDKDLMKAAESLGASKFTAFLKVVVPLCVPGLVVGSILIFVGSLTAYTTPQLLGGKQRVVSTLLYQYAMTLNDWYMASVIATILIVITFVVIGMMNKLTQRINPKG